MHRYNSAKVSLQKQIVSDMNSKKEYFKQLCAKKAISISEIKMHRYKCEEKEKFEFTHINERNNSEIKGGTNNGN